MKKAYYCLTFFYADQQNNQHFFMIGYFSKLENARDTIKTLSSKNGFEEFGGEFVIKKKFVHFRKTPSKEKCLTLFELSHEYFNEQGYDVSVIIGIFPSYTEAEKRMLSLKDSPPFCIYPEGFMISEIKVDSHEWDEGFESW